ncbi:MAG TPA: ABC transporter permease [Acidobacteriota bacterium]|nr:ABC transporter permease [Acidobacteriota bacterium]
MRMLRLLSVTAVQALIAIAFLATWEIAGRAHFISPIFFPVPSVVVRTVFDLFRSGELIVHLGATLSRMAGGFLVGGLPGVMLGLLMGWSPRLKVLLDPFVAALHPVPKISLLPLVMILLGIGEAPNLVVIGLASFFPMLISSLAGVQQISPLYCEVAKNYGATTLRMFHRVILPGSLPLVFAGIRLAVNSALVVTISVELVAAQTGLGSMIWTAWETLRIEALYATVLLTALLGLTFSVVLNHLARWAIPWQT